MATDAKANFVSNRLTLPLFLAGRNRLREAQPPKVPAYIAKKRLLYAGRCNEENATETATTRHFKHLAGFYPHSPPHECAKSRMSKCSRDLEVYAPWRLPPNVYDAPKVPFTSRKGLSGAYWRKLPKTKARAPASKEEQKRRLERRGVWKFYDLQQSVLERWGGTCRKHKGIFVSNARSRRATSRSMINNPTTCHHDPNDPGPATFNPNNFDIAANITPPKKFEPFNPHLFLPNSCVPAGHQRIIKPHISFDPAPGRYEIRFPRSCACTKNKIYMPDLQLLVDRQKRHKFRRQPYIKIRVRRYCTPDWRHVPGNGFRRLFRLPKGKRRKKAVKAAKDTKKTEKPIQLYTDAKYLSLINSPLRVPISMRTEPIPELPIPVRYNCITKRTIRKQLRNNKKIVFNSGQDRFPELEWRPVLFTVSMLEKLKKTLPPERRFEDHPVMRKSPSQIIGKLYETPDHMKPAYELSLRKRLFKFLPLPPPKVLVTEHDTYPDVAEGETYEPHRFFGKKIDAKKFFKGETKKPPQQPTNETAQEPASQPTQQPTEQTTQQTTQPQTSQAAEQPVAN